ncbi:MAG: universal stress protein [Candidatus Binatus sp.]
MTAIAKQHLADVKYEILDEMGEPGNVIPDIAAKLPADLIVMVTHGRRGLARLIEGSIAEKVLRNAPCPVLAVRQDQ